MMGWHQPWTERVGILLDWSNQRCSLAVGHGLAQDSGLAFTVNVPGLEADVASRAP